MRATRGFVGAATDSTFNRGWLFVPIIGHVVFAATTDTYIGFFAGILVAGTLTQALGVFLFAVGFAWNREDRVRARIRQMAVSVVPFADRTTAGLAVLGQF